MINPKLEQELHKHLDQLSIEDQQEVLAYVKKLTAGQGVRGTSLLQFSGYVPSDELNQMAVAIEQGCEQVNHNEW